MTADRRRKRPRGPTAGAAAAAAVLVLAACSNDSATPTPAPTGEAARWVVDTVDAPPGERILVVTDPVSGTDRGWSVDLGGGIWTSDDLATWSTVDGELPEPPWSAVGAGTEAVMVVGPAPAGLRLSVVGLDGSRRDVALAVPEPEGFTVTADAVEVAGDAEGGVLVVASLRPVRTSATGGSEPAPTPATPSTVAPPAYPTVAPAPTAAPDYPTVTPSTSPPVTYPVTAPAPDDDPTADTTDTPRAGTTPLAPPVDGRLALLRALGVTETPDGSVPETIPVAWMLAPGSAEAGAPSALVAEAGAVGGLVRSVSAWETGWLVVLDDATLRTGLAGPDDTGAWRTVAALVTEPGPGSDTGRACRPADAAGGVAAIAGAAAATLGVDGGDLRAVEIDLPTPPLCVGAGDGGVWVGGRDGVVALAGPDPTGIGPVTVAALDVGAGSALVVAEDGTAHRALLDLVPPDTDGPDAGGGAAVDDAPGLGRSIGSPEAGPRPEHPGDRGGWAQLLTLAVLAGGVGVILWRILHAARRIDRTATS